MAALANPSRLAVVKHPVPRELDALVEAALTTCKNKRLLKLKRGAEAKLFLPDGRELGEDVAPEELGPEVVLLVGDSLWCQRPCSAPALGCSFHEVSGGKLALWHRPGDKHFEVLARAGCTLIVTVLGETEGAYHIEREARRAQMSWKHVDLRGAKLEHLAAHLERLKQAAVEVAAEIRGGAVVLVHCSAGAVLCNSVMCN